MAIIPHSLDKASAILLDGWNMVRIEVVVLNSHQDFLQAFILDVAEGLLQHVEHPRAVRVELYAGVAIKPVRAARGCEVKPNTFSLYGRI